MKVNVRLLNGEHCPLARNRFALLKVLLGAFA